MAYNPQGVMLETRATVTDPLIRRYSFSFPVTRAADVSLEVEGTVLPVGSYTVRLNVDYSGGLVELLDAQASTTPAPALEVGQSIRIYRDTEVARRTSFGSAGFARAATAETQASQTHRILEELADRLTTHETIILGRDQLVALVNEVLTSRATGGLGSVTRGDLTENVRNEIDAAAVASTFQFSETTLTVYDGEGREFQTDLGALEGITLQKDGETQGGYGDIKRLNFSGGVSISVTGDQATVTLTAGTGVTSSQVETLIEAHEHVSTGYELDEALRKEVPLATNVAHQQGLSNALGYLTGLGAVPSGLYAGKFEVKVDSGDWHRFSTAALLAKPAVINGTQASVSNSLRYSQGDNTISIAHDAGGAFLVASDDVGSHTFSVRSVPILVDDSLLEVKEPAKLGSTGKWTAAELPTASGSEAGIISPAEYARIADAVSATDLHSTPQLANDHLAGDDAILLDDASVTSGSELKEVPVSELDKRWAGKAEAAASWAREGQTAPVQSFTEHQQAVFDMVSGTDHWKDSTTIQVSFPNQAAGVGAGSIAAIGTYVASVSVSPRQTNLWCAIKVPDAEMGNVGHTLRLSIEESEGTGQPPILDWGTAVATTGGFTYYAVQVPDAPVGAVIRVEELDPLELNTDYIDSAQWRRAIVGHVGITFAEQYPGVSPTTTTTDQLVAAAEALSPAFDLDDAVNQHGEFHVSVELKMTQSHSTVSFTENAASPGAEDRQRTISAILFASDLREEDAFTTSNLKGLTIANVPVYAAATEQGRYYLLLVRDSANRVGLYRHWVGAAGSSGMTISAEVRVTFTPSDEARLPQSYSARGGLIARIAVTTTSALTLPAGSRLTTFPGVQTPFLGTGDDKFQAGATGGWLQVPRIPPVNRVGFIIEGKINGVVVSRSFVPNTVFLFNANVRNFTGGNIPMGIGVPLSDDNTFRFVGIEFQRQLSTSHKDAMYFYVGGAGRNAYKTNSRIDIYEWRCHV